MYIYIYLFRFFFFSGGRGVVIYAKLEQPLIHEMLLYYTSQHFSKTVQTYPDSKKHVSVGEDGSLRQI